jgi:hypothetical protein
VTTPFTVLLHAVGMMPVKVHKTCASWSSVGCMGYMDGGSLGGAGQGSKDS